MALENVYMQKVAGQPNAYEYSNTVSSETTPTGSDTQGKSAPLYIPSNVAVVTMGIRRKTGDGGFSVEVTMSTLSEVRLGTAEWFTWDIPGVDASGYYGKDSVDDDDVLWWVPIPGTMRFVVEPSTTTTVYFSLRAN